MQAPAIRLPSVTSASRHDRADRGQKRGPGVPRRRIESRLVIVRFGMSMSEVAVRLGTMAVHYRAPGWLTRNVFNRAVAFLTRHGVSILGSRVLAVRGRTSGAWRTTPVNLLEHDGRRYLVSARGHGQWVRNLRAAGTGELRVGKRNETFRSRELTDEEKVPVLREYLRRWKMEVGAFFGGVGPDSSDDQLRAIARDHPAFEVLPAA
jgi:deazaflavin-dependent oxidoreductase (nitroreductase family)